MSCNYQSVNIFIPEGKQSITHLIIYGSKLPNIRTVKFFEKFLVSFSFLNSSDIIAYLPSDFFRLGFQEVSCFFKQLKFKNYLFHYWFITSVCKGTKCFLNAQHFVPFSLSYHYLFAIEDVHA